jgi:hypothetical protein
VGQPLLGCLGWVAKRKFRRCNNAKLSHLECALTRQSTPNPFRIRTYRKHGGGWVGLCAGLRSAGKSELAGWGVGDFSEDGGAVGSGGGGDVARAMMQRFIGHQGEGEGFFGVFGDAKIGGPD